MLVKKEKNIHTKASEVVKDARLLNEANKLYNSTVCVRGKLAVGHSHILFISFVNKKKKQFYILNDFLTRRVMCALKSYKPAFPLVCRHTAFFNLIYLSSIPSVIGEKLILMRQISH